MANEAALRKEDVAHVAKLSRIDLSAEETDAFVAELNPILAWVAQLQEVDTTDVPLMTSVVENLPLPMRADEVNDGDKQQDVLANAPENNFGCYTVPKVIE